MQTRKSKSKTRTKTNYRWLVKIILVSVIASIVFTFASSKILGRAGTIVAFLILIVFIGIGVLFDIVGVAVVAAHEAPFHSMATRRQRGAAEAIRLLKNAGKVSSFCNDVVGDVSGIISGATAALIAAKLMQSLSAESLLIQLLIPGAVTGLTIGGKAAGKTLAFNHSTAIVFRVGKLMSFFSKRLR